MSHWEKDMTLSYVSPILPLCSPTLCMFYSRTEHSQSFFICLLKFSFHNIAKPVLQKVWKFQMPLLDKVKRTFYCSLTPVTSLGYLGSLVLAKARESDATYIYK